MRPVIRQVLILGACLGLTLLLAGTGLVKRFWIPSSRLLTGWRQNLAATGPADSALMRTQEELARLKSQMLTLQAELSALTEMSQAGVNPERVILRRAAVLGRSRRIGRHFWEITGGGADGVRQGMAAVSGWSLVGVVEGEAERTSLVRLITDPESRVPVAVIGQKTDTEGQSAPMEVARGVAAGTGDRVRLDIRFVDDRPGREVLTGMDVVSLGGTGEVPPGLMIGRVVLAERSPQSALWHIEASPLRRLDDLDQVLILRPAEVHP